MAYLRDMRAVDCAAAWPSARETSPPRIVRTRLRFARVGARVEVSEREREKERERESEKERERVRKREKERERKRKRERDLCARVILEMKLRLVYTCM
jgi:hypothetical protein